VTLALPIVEYHGAVVTTGDDPLVVRAEDSAPNPLMLIAEFGDQLLTLVIPDADFTLHGPDDDERFIVGEARGRSVLGRRLKNIELFPGADVPKRETVTEAVSWVCVYTCRGYHLRIG
jgi:hypothetical protein